VRSVKGVLPIAIRAKAEGKIGLLAPKDNAPEAAVVHGLQVIPIQNLREAVGFLQREVKISPTRVDITRIFEHSHEDELDFADVKGQESVKLPWKSPRRAAPTRSSSVRRARASRCSPNGCPPFCRR